MSRPAFAAFCLALAAVGCGPGAVFEERPLLDPDDPPLVVAERKRLALPVTGPGNRYVSGWRFESEAGELKILPEGRSARLEIVQLRRWERRLTLESTSISEGGIVNASIGGRPLEVETSEANIVVRLPEDLTVGRHLIDLEFSDIPPRALRGAVLDRAAPAGTLRVAGDDLVHQPWSAAEFVRWVPAASRLLGELVVERSGELGPRFSIGVESDDGRDARVFEFRSPRGGSGTAVEAIDVPLRSTPGLVRIRLAASGKGPAGRWRGLRIANPSESAAGGDSGRPEPPRVVLVYVFDALRGDLMGHLGSTIGASPCVDRLAAEGAVFENHFSAAPNTGPSTKSLFTGYGYLRGRPLSETGPETLAEVYTAAGFRAASFSSNYHISPGLGLTRGFDHYDLLPLDFESRDGRDVTVNDSAERVHSAALEWVDEQTDRTPLFLYLHTLNPHNPYSPPEPYPGRFSTNDRSAIDGQTETLTAIQDFELTPTGPDREKIRGLYAANLAYNDAELCALVDEIETRHPGEVMVIVTSDHGEELFDHGGVLHGYTLYDELIHVPLVVWWPGRIAPRRIDRLSGTLDLHATLRDLVGSPAAVQSGPARSLWPAMAGKSGGAEEPQVQFAVAPGLRNGVMARSRNWKLILTPRPRFEWGMGRGPGRTHEAEYVFDLDVDPGELVNLAGSTSVEVDWLRGRLQGWWAMWAALQPDEVDRTEIDRETRRQLEALGYVE